LLGGDLHWSLRVLFYLASWGLHRFLGGHSFCQGFSWGFRAQFLSNLLDSELRQLLNHFFNCLLEGIILDLLSKLDNQLNRRISDSVIVIFQDKLYQLLLRQFEHLLNHRRIRMLHKLRQWVLNQELLNTWVFVCSRNSDQRVTKTVDG
jgi:hypothetical protein